MDRSAWIPNFEGRARAGDSGGIFSSDGGKVGRQNFQNKSLAANILGTRCSMSDLFI